MPLKVVKSLYTSLTLDLTSAYQKSHREYWVEQSTIYKYPPEVSSKQCDEMPKYWAEQLDNILYLRDIVIDSKPKHFANYGRREEALQYQQRSHKVLWECRPDFLIYKKIVDEQKEKEQQEERRKR